MAQQPGKRVAVIGGGWAGLAAAIDLVHGGCEVVLYEMAAQLGGRARSVHVDGVELDNGQHILIGAYTQTLALLRRIDVDAGSVLSRQPLSLCAPDGTGLRLPSGHPVFAFARGVWTAKHWSLAERARLLHTTALWAARGFRCPPQLTVAELTARLPQRLCTELFEPLCVAALNTPAAQASAQVFLRVLRDALFAGPGASDLLLPRRGLSQLLPLPAQAWLLAHGARIELGTRVQALAGHAAGWLVNGERFDAAVLACTAAQAATLVEPVNADWAAQARSLRYEPIITVYLHAPGARWPNPMVALACSGAAPAQFGFDLGALGGAAGVFALVISGARTWVERGLDAAALACQRQAVRDFPAHTWPQQPSVLRTLAEKRATFACTPNLQRPPMQVAPGLLAAGDHVQGPYPATLEGAVRAGRAAAASLLE